MIYYWLDRQSEMWCWIFRGATLPADILGTPCNTKEELMENIKASIEHLGGSMQSIDLVNGEPPRE
jgi:hypothetical protein